MLIEMSLKDFADALASRESLPGGGCAAALTASLGAALAGMVARLTLGKERFAGSADNLRRLSAEADRLRLDLLEDVDQDAESYRRVLAAYRKPKGSVEKDRARREAIQSAFKGATESPLRMAENALRVMDLAAEAAGQGDPALITDAGMGLLLARSAGLGALMNARINLDTIDDQDYVGHSRTRAAHLEDLIARRERDFFDLPSVRALYDPPS